MSSDTLQNDSASSCPTGPSPLSSLFVILVGLGVTCFFTSALLFLWDIGCEAMGAKPAFAVERIAVFLILPACLFFFLASVWYALKERTIGAWRHVAYQIAAFLILALSLTAFGLHNPVQKLLGEPISEQVVAANKSAQEHATTDTARNIAEISAVMVLFVLAELAAFVGHDVNEAMQRLKKWTTEVNEAAERTKAAAQMISQNLLNLQETTDRISQIRLVASVAMLHPDVQEGTVRLIHAWGDRVPAIKTDTGESDSGGSKPNLSDLSWRILLREYVREESADIAPKSIKREGIPKSVEPVEDTNPQDVSFVATNVAFYARFLSSLVDELSPAGVTTESQLCMAIVTNALPAHCWNWPMPDGAWRSYGPIDAYRSSMLRAVSRGAQIDRVLLVYDDSDEGSLGENNPMFFAPYDGIFWRQKLLDQMLSSWWKLVPVSGGFSTVECSTAFPDERGELGTTAFPLFPVPVRQAAVQPSGFIYPFIIKGDGVPATIKDRVNAEWKAASLLEEYKRLHGERGMFWKLALKRTAFDYFEGRHDIMFIGRGKGSANPAGLWTEFEDCEWGICLMSSMNAVTATMFLTVISGKAVKLHYEWCRRRLYSVLDWTAKRLNPAAKGR